MPELESGFKVTVACSGCFERTTGKTARIFWVLVMLGEQSRSVSLSSVALRNCIFFPYSSPQGLIYRTVRHDPHIYKTRKAGDCVLFPSCHTKFAFLSEHCLKKLPAFILAVSRGLFREGPGWCLWNTHFVCSCALNLLKSV